MKVNTKYQEMKLGFAALVYALILFLVLINGLFASNQPTSNDGWSFWYMFTNQSNILVMIWLILYGIGTFFDVKLKKLVENNTLITAVTVYISITFFIVATVLEPFYKAEFNPLNSFFAHFTTAVVMWFFFFAVRGNGSVRYRQAFYILIYPFVFVIINLIVGYNVKYYNGDAAFAYGFINPNNYGNLAIFVLVIILLIGVFGGFGVLLIKFKRFLNTHYHDKLAPNILFQSFDSDVKIDDNDTNQLQLKLDCIEDLKDTTE